VTLRDAARRALLATGTLPSRYMWRNPFKIMEFGALTSGMNILPTDTILDIGCGSGPQDLLLARLAGRVVGIDPSESEIARARNLAAVYAAGRGLEYRCTPIEAGGFRDGEFDKVVSFSVFEHIANRDVVLDTVARVLKPGGLLRMSCDSMATLTDPALIAQHRAQGAVLTYFKPAELRAMLEQRGFRDIRLWALFRGDYARREFEDAIRRNHRHDRYGKFWPLVRMTVEESFTPAGDVGLFLCVSAVKAE
jgi:2-polyprenyl-3-methyl-5-hydroxy-6-metoxy-1,4-benzoquinol methylase